MNGSVEKWIDFNFSKIYQNETYAVYYFDLQIEINYYIIYNGRKEEERNQKGVKNEENSCINTML